MLDQSEKPINITPIRPVTTSGTWSSLWTNTPVDFRTNDWVGIANTNTIINGAVNIPNAGFFAATVLTLYGTNADQTITVSNFPGIATTSWTLTNGGRPAQWTFQARTNSAVPWIITQSYK